MVALLTTLGAMRLRLFLLLTTLAGALLVIPATASAYFVHVIAPGETLSSIAAADGLTVAELAVANGLSPSAQLVAGSTLQIPPQQSGVSAPVSAPSAPSTSAASSAPAPTTTGDGDNDADDVGSSSTAAAASASAGASSGVYVVQPGDTLSAIAARAGLSLDSLAAANGLDPNGVLVSGTVLQLSGASAPASTTVPVSATTTTTTGSYVVQPGDTLTAIAARAGLSPSSLAAANGLNPNGVLVSGTVLHVAGSPSSAAVSSAAASQPVGAVAEGSPTAPPYPTPERVTAPQVGSIASANGVPPALADAIAWQESGFNNDLVSSADARGVMQILPGTWQWIQRSLDTGAPLAPASAADNVRGGVLMLHSLLDATGGDPAMAAAGYFQGLPSVQQHGLYPDTQRYVQSVLALEHQFGGG
jgi:N-acetylmuramoyl-L-alanine amidase